MGSSACYVLDCGPGCCLSSLLFPFTPNSSQFQGPNISYPGAGYGSNVVNVMNRQAPMNYV